MTESAFRLASQEYDPAIPVESISEHPANPNEGATTVLDEMLAEHGFYGAIIIQKSTRFIIAGNHRHREAVKLGAETLPGFWLDVDDEQAAKMMAGDNESTRLGRTDEAKLLALLKPLSSLAGSGYKPLHLIEIAALLGRRSAFGDEPTDPSAEWEGMPDFEQGSLEPVFSAHISFATMGDAEQFFRLIDRPVASKLWWPQSDGHRGMNASEMEVQAGG